MGAFKAGLEQVHPDVPSTAWTPFVSNLTMAKAQSFPAAARDQYLVAWKKWMGVAFALDAAEETARVGATSGFAYALMLDAEILLYNASDCGSNSEWHKLYDRIRIRELSKLWYAAQVSNKRVYDFGGTLVTGR